MASESAKWSASESGGEPNFSMRFSALADDSNDSDTKDSDTKDSDTKDSDTKDTDTKDTDKEAAPDPAAAKVASFRRPHEAKQMAFETGRDPSGQQGSDDDAV